MLFLVLITGILCTSTLIPLLSFTFNEKQCFLYGRQSTQSDAINGLMGLSSPLINLEKVPEFVSKMREVEEEFFPKRFFIVVAESVSIYMVSVESDSLNVEIAADGETTEHLVLCSQSSFQKPDEGENVDSEGFGLYAVN